MSHTIVSSTPHYGHHWWW